MAVVEKKAQKVEACNMILYPHPLRHSKFEESRDQLQPGSLLPLGCHRREPGNEVGFENVFCCFKHTFFVCASATQCLEVIPIGLMDCNDKALLTTGTIYPSNKLYWVEVINFERNNIVHVNDTELFSWFPNLRLIDLCENPNLDCRAVWELKITVRSDCKFLSFIW